MVLPPKIGIVVTQNMDLTIEQLEFHDFTNKRIDMNRLLNQQQLGFNHQTVWDLTSGADQRTMIPIGCSRNNLV